MANKGLSGPLASAAAAFEDELLRYAELAGELRSNPMNTQKAIGRAKTALQESVDCEQRMSSRLAALSAALNGAREQQVSVAADTLESAKRVQARVGSLSALMERFAALGEQARAIQEPLGGAPADSDAAQTALRLHEVTSRMEAVSSEAQSLADAAEADDWKDLARDATSLKQQTQAARNKALLVLRKLPSGAPS